MPDQGQSVPLFGMGGRRSRAELAEAFDALVASLHAAEKALGRRPRQLAELDRSVATLYELIFIRQKDGGPSVLNLLEQHTRRLELLEELVDELRAVGELPPRPLRALGGGR